MIDAGSFAKLYDEQVALELQENIWYSMFYGGRRVERSCGRIYGDRRRFTSWAA